MPIRILLQSHGELPRVRRHTYSIGKPPNETIQSKEVRHGTHLHFLLNFTKQMCTLGNTVNPLPDLLLALRRVYVYPKELKGCINGHSWRGRKLLRFLSTKSLKLRAAVGGGGKFKEVSSYLVSFSTVAEQLTRFPQAALLQFPACIIRWRLAFIFNKYFLWEKWLLAQVLVLCILKQQLSN